MNKAIKRKNVEEFKEKDLNDILALGGKVDEINTNTFRITFPRFRIDYFPSSNRIFWHSNKKWGYCYDIISEVELQIKETK